MKKTLVALSLAATLASTAAFAEVTRQQAGDAITQAVIANNKVSAAGFEWRDTYKKLIQPAKAAYKKVDYDKAFKLAEKARAHAELGMKQAEVAATAGPRF